MSRRRDARELAFRAVYQSDVTGEAPDRCLSEILDAGSPPEDVCEFARTLVETLVAHREDIDEAVSKTARNWPLHRMAATDRSVLRLAAAEILYHTETPVRVALDEAIEIAKKYGMETSGAFVNGILDRIAYGARPSAR